MERLTHKRENGIKRGYWSPNKKQELVDRLAMYEDREDAKDAGENRIEILYLNELGRWHGDFGEPNGKVIAWMSLPTPCEKGE